jgi:hypothetical protein
MVKAEVYGPENYNSCANRVKKLTGIVLIFHPGCGHCVQMRPEWEAMKRKLSNTKVVEVDGSAMSENQEMSESPVAKRTDGFPKIFNVKNGQVQDEFIGQRTADEMKRFAEKGQPKTKTKKNKTRKRMVRKRMTGKRMNQKKK